MCGDLDFQKWLKIISIEVETYKYIESYSLFCIF